ncbi:MAG: DUF1826 domain-containing protein [Bacteroidota bacterium]
MNILASIPFLRPTPNTPKQVISRSWSEREKVLSKDVNLFCWKRSLDSSIQRFLLEVLNRNVESLKYSINQYNLRQQLGKGMVKWNACTPVSSESFWQDVFMLANDFMVFSKDGLGSLHLQIVDNNACSKFHTDGYPLRLFTTYAGPGTEWLPEEVVDRSALGTTNERIVKDHRKIQQMNPGDVSILKGEISNHGKATRGIVHKSPEIKQTGEKRIILRIDI